MKICLDCRYLGMSGIGRFTEGVMRALPDRHEYFFLGDPEKTGDVDRAHVIPDVRYPLSARGLKVNGRVNDCDAFVTPDFVLPYGVRVPTFSVIHDVVFFDLPSTTNGVVDRAIKKHLYSRCVKRSRAIMTVSEFSRSRILAHFPKCRTDISVVGGGISAAALAFDTNNVEKGDYFVFVGNIKKQKGLDTLLDALALLGEGELYIAGEDKNFRTMDEKVAARLRDERVHFTGRLGDDELFSLVARARYLVQPSTYEGFGLPPLEALALGTVPIVSDIPVFREVYSDYPAVFFRTGDAEDLAEKMSAPVPALPADMRERIARDHGFGTVAERVISCVERHM